MFYGSIASDGHGGAWVVTISLLYSGLWEPWCLFCRGILFCFLRLGALADAEAGLGGGVVDLCGARRFADFISGV